MFVTVGQGMNKRLRNAEANAQTPEERMGKLELHFSGIEQKLTKWKWILALLFAILSVERMLNLPFKNTVEYILVYGIYCFVAMKLIPAIDNFVLNKYTDLSSPSGAQRSFLLHGFMIYLSLILYWSATDALGVKNNKPGNRVTITYNGGEQLHTNDTTVFIGRTKNFTFLYNRYARQKAVIKNDDIKIITFQESP
jgi:hypothetical protein